MLAGFAAFAGQAAVVYKWTDANGVVHYSDQSVPGAEKIYTASGPAGSSSRGSASSDPSSAPSAKKEAAGLGYTEFAVSSPAPEQTFFGDEIIPVNLTLVPGLKPGQTINWHLNGKELQDTSAHFTLPRLDRGAYVIAATITDQETGEARTSDSVTFYVRQPSELEPLHKHP